MVQCASSPAGLDATLPWSTIAHPLSALCRTRGRRFRIRWQDHYRPGPRDLPLPEIEPGHVDRILEIGCDMNTGWDSQPDHGSSAVPDRSEAVPGEIPSR